MKPFEKPLFIPLKTEFFAAFASGEKTVEFRPYGARWNERTCAIGREVVLSCGYGKNNRLRGVIFDFERSAEPTKSEAWRQCYGDRFVGDAACIHIRLIDEAVGCGEGRTASIANDAVRPSPHPTDRESRIDELEKAAAWFESGEWHNEIGFVVLECTPGAVAEQLRQRSTDLRSNA